MQVTKCRSIGIQVNRPPPVNCPRSDAPCFFATPVNSPLDKTPPGQTLLPVSGRESMYSAT